MAKLDFPSSDQSPWTNPDTGITYVWKGGSQGAWHIASTGDTDIFVAKTGDKMTGNLTLGPDGDTNITLDAADGSATLAGSLQVDGNTQIEGYVLGDYFSAYRTDDYPLGAVFRGSRPSAGLGVYTSQINADGSGEFAGPVKAQYFRGIYDPVNISSNPEDYTCVRADDEDGNVVAALYADGHAMFEGRLQVNETSTIYVGDARITSQDYGLCFTSNGSAVEFGVKYDGSATFARTINGARGTATNSTVPFCEQFSKDQSSVSENQSVIFSRHIIRAGSSNAHLYWRVSGGGTSTTSLGLWQLYASRGSDDALTSGAKITLTGNGDATFMGTVTVNGNRPLILATEPENDDNYTVTTEEYTETESYTGPLGNTLEREVTKTRDVRTYTGPTLDVKERLQNLITRLDSLEADEVTDDATSTLLLTTVNNLNADMTKTKAALTAIRTAANAAGTLEQLKADIATATADI